MTETSIGMCCGEITDLDGLRAALGVLILIETARAGLTAISRFSIARSMIDRILVMTFLAYDTLQPDRDLPFTRLNFPLSRTTTVVSHLRLGRLFTISLRSSAVIDSMVRFPITGLMECSKIAFCVASHSSPQSA